jgi:CheY-like chemotaxis protein
VSERILVVDDDPDFVEATRLVLEAHGYEVVSAANGAQGLARVQEERPDLVMYDDPEHRDIPILMVTSIANTDYAVLFPTDEYIHIDGFMSKPISPNRLLNAVERLLSRTRDHPSD